MGNLHSNYRNATRRLLYGPLVASYTEKLYRVFLEGCVDGATILDIGVGDGASLCKCADVIKKANLHIVGIDICRDSLSDCIKNIAEYGLEEHVVVGTSDELLHTDTPKFDYAFLSNSYSVIGDIQNVINVALSMTKDSQCTIALALYERPSRALSFIKRNLHRILGFHCGRYITHTSLATELMQMDTFIVDKNYTCSNKLFGFTLADIFTLLIERIPTDPDDDA